MHLQMMVAVWKACLRVGHVGFRTLYGCISVCVCMRLCAPTSLNFPKTIVIVIKMQALHARRRAGCRCRCRASPKPGELHHWDLGWGRGL